MGGTLIHACCAPDALYFIKRFREEHPGERLVCFFYDPNIHPPEEYKLRMIETLRVCREMGIEFIEGDYDPERWLLKVKGLEEEPEGGRRCLLCFDIRLEKSAGVARDLGCEAFTTTLLMSPRKDPGQLREAGERVARLFGLRFLAPDYRKGGGTQEMFRVAREKGLYLQNYCGCIYSRRGELIAFRGRRPGTREETLLLKELRLFAESWGLRVREEEFPFLNWRVLEGFIRVQERSLPSFVLPYSASLRGKVRGRVVEEGDGVLYLGRQFVRIVLLEEFRDLPLDEPRVLAEPTFLVPAGWRERLKKERIEASLRTEVFPDVSRWLLIGEPEAERLLGVPADTLQDGRGVNVMEVLRSRLPELKRGSLALVVLGAQSLGRAGQRHFEERTGRRIDQVLGFSDL
ncbi:MAG TPA: epoxyqueuosine reductase QueH [Aquifex aeolicus]|uniref:Epoxyqueuosine reductase QueH n=1 Tax=Aquifex aeolicus TaxID=63363 RepID=A0A7C5Q9C3_AQUAO|nr:epoxyqueuosine reductase QueH [Aquifex aeolicus]